MSYVVCRMTLTKLCRLRFDNFFRAYIKFCSLGKMSPYVVPRRMSYFVVCRMTIFFGMFFFGGPSWRFFFRLQLGSFWASCGSLGASQNPSALCIKSGWAGASVALKIRSEYLVKEPLLLLGGPGGPTGALRKPKKFRLGSLAASSGRRTDPLIYTVHPGRLALKP